MTLIEGIQAQFFKIVALLAALSAALLGQAELIGEPYHHYLSIAGIVSGTLIAWNIKQHPVKEIA